MENDKTLNAIATRIKQRRKELGLSLQEVSDKAGISKSTLQRYETGSIKNIPLRKLASLSRALKTSADWILGWRKDADERTSIDNDLNKILDYLGYRLDAWPRTGAQIYIHCDSGSGPITESEYRQFRDSIVSYILFNVTNLANMAINREERRMESETEKLCAYLSSIQPIEEIEERKQEE